MRVPEELSWRAFSAVLVRRPSCCIHPAHNKDILLTMKIKCTWLSKKRYNSQGKLEEESSQQQEANRGNTNKGRSVIERYSLGICRHDRSIETGSGGNSVISSEKNAWKWNTYSIFQEIGLHDKVSTKSKYRISNKISSVEYVQSIEPEWHSDTLVWIFGKSS